jgi:hypothetical protein
MGSKLHIRQIRSAHDCKRVKCVALTPNINLEGKTPSNGRRTSSDALRPLRRHLTYSPPLIGQRGLGVLISFEKILIRCLRSNIGRGMKPRPPTCPETQTYFGAPLGSKGGRGDEYGLFIFLNVSPMKFELTKGAAPPWNPLRAAPRGKPRGIFAARHSTVTLLARFRG